MEDFYPKLFLWLGTCASHLIGLIFFSRAILRQIRGQDFLGVTLWGFAFMVLGYWGNYLIGEVISQ